MQELYSSTENKEGMNDTAIHALLNKLIEEMKGAKNILLVPPDFTRCYSYAGPITEYLYLELSKFASVSVIPALGTHAAMTVTERTEMFGTHIPNSAFIIHDWQNDVVKIGEIPSSVVSEISNGTYAEKIEVEVNHHLVDQTYDQIISIGQVVPHEIVGLANYTKNLLVGLGGRDMINKSHFVGALCNMEKALGVIDTPARLLFDYAQKNFLVKLPITFVFTVTTFLEETLTVHGVFIGKSRKAFEEAAQLSQKYNIVHVEKRAKKVIT
ncbi:MAG: DUF2088 domain-containing protein, partial [Peptostreptococcaceae bacterium]|nr:DUF2088 domain-containing protein [Peptostreptococcaceae bacterium]